MKRSRAKVLLRLGFALATGQVCSGCGSNDEIPAGCAGDCAGMSGNDASGSGGTDGASGSAGTGGASGSAGTEASGGTSGNDAGPDAEQPDTGVTCSPCNGYGAPMSAGNLENPLLLELSGIAASRTHPGVFYAHNDSGDGPRFFAFDGSGNTIGEFLLQGIAAVDWEDMAVGPCPAGSCLFFGDIGDNDLRRTSVSIVRVIEPDLAADASVGTVNVAHDRFEYSYEPGPQNAEALLAHPSSGDLFIVTKSTSGTSMVFRIDAPTTPGVAQTLSRLVDLALPTPGARLVTAGDIHPCGDRLLLRTYDALFEYVAAANSPFETAFAAAPQIVPAAAEPQGEAVTYLHDGRGYVTASEGQSAPLNVARCQ